MPKKILFVDDEDWSVNSYFEVLKDHDLEVKLASNGGDAIALMQQEKFDLLVLDVMFAPGAALGENVEPRQAGARLLSVVRSQSVPGLCVPGDVPVVILTAVTNQKLLDDISAMKVAKILRKPIAFEEVVGTLLRTLGIESEF